MSKPEPIANVAQHPEKADQMSKTTMAALKNIKKYAFPSGAILSCACGCGYTKEKTSEEMTAYLKSWPKMHGYLANVRPK